jgi:hypothetical protein
MHSKASSTICRRADRSQVIKTGALFHKPYAETSATDPAKKTPRECGALSETVKSGYFLAASSFAQTAIWSFSLSIEVVILLMSPFRVLAFSPISSVSGISLTFAASAWSS